MRLDGTTVLAVGTTGAQGSGLVEALEARGAVPVRVTSSAERAAGWRAGGVRAAHADLTDPATVARVADAEGAAAAVLHVPLGLGPDDAARLVESVAALRAGDRPVAVNLGTPVPPEGVPDPFGARGLAAALLATGATALTPTAYLENHAAPWSASAIAAGELPYPRPADDVIAWITARDVTAAAVAALATGGGGELLVLAGPEPLTFDRLATELGAGLGRPLRFRRVTPQEFGDLMRPFLGDAAADGVAAAYGAMPEEPNPLMAPDATATWARLGVRPTTARDWAAAVLDPALTAAAQR